MNRNEDNLNLHDDLNMNDILANHTNKTHNKNTDPSVIWREPLEESFLSPKNPFADSDKKKKPINIHLDDEDQDSPSDFLKNNQTVRFDQENKSRRTMPWDADSFINTWPKSGSFENDNNAYMGTEAQATSPLYQTTTTPTPSIKTRTFTKPDLELDNDTPIIMKSGFSSAPKATRNVTENRNTTKILFDDSVIDQSKADLTKEIDDAENITLNPKNTKQVSAKKIARMKQKQILKDQYKQVPKFFRFEYKNSKLGLIVSSILMSGILGGLGYLIFLTVTSALDYWLLLPAGIVTIFFSTIFTKSMLDFGYIRKDLKNNNYQIDHDNPTASMRKMYKKLLGANISLNWISASVYMACGLAVLLTYLVTYFINLTSLEYNDFTRLIIGADNNLPVYFLWSFVGLAGTMLIIQIIYNFINYKRRNDMELFYTVPIIDEVSATKIRHSANVKGGIIFSFSVLVLGIVVMLVYLIIRRKKAV